jgi:hypothetical protein
MNTPWIIFLLAIIIGFTILESYAFKHPDRENTLSRFVWSVGQKWPLSLVLWGMLIGGLSVHFFWNWCPALMPLGAGG